MCSIPQLTSQQQTTFSTFHSISINDSIIYRLKITETIFEVCPNYRHSPYNFESTDVAPVRTFGVQLSSLAQKTPTLQNFMCSHARATAHAV